MAMHLTIHLVGGDALYLNFFDRDGNSLENYVAKALAKGDTVVLHPDHGWRVLSSGSVQLRDGSVVQVPARQVEFTQWAFGK